MIAKGVLSLPRYLQEMQAQISTYAQAYGLDYFPVDFEVVDYNQMNELAAYGGFPVRYPHWRFGMEYEQLKKSHEYGLSKIYEMVINTNPSIAYLLEGNSQVDQKLVMSHVFAHVDFFKNNFAFRATDQGRDPKTGAPIRRWVDTMANHGSSLRRWSERVGADKVEAFVDDVLSLENLIDPQKPFVPAKPPQPEARESDPPFSVADEVGRMRVEHEYMEDYINPTDFVRAEKQKAHDDHARAQKLPASADRDVLGFLLEHAPLERWERDVVSAIRAEAYYFWPQMQTKIMNEGWASYWHSRLMTEKVCNDAEIIEYADRNAGVMETGQGRLNPYKLGVELYRHIEDRWNKGQFGAEWDACDDLEKRQAWHRHTGLGRQKIFEIRKLHTDVTFIDEYLTPEFARENKLYTFGFNDKSGRLEIESHKFQEVKEKLLAQLTNAGQPFISVVDANHRNQKVLLLEHTHMGMDLKLDWARKVLAAMVRVWKRPVELHTRVEGKLTALFHDGGSVHETQLT